MTKRNLRLLFNIIFSVLFVLYFGLEFFTNINAFYYFIPIIILMIICLILRDKLAPKNGRWTMKNIKNRDKKSTK